MAKIFITGGTGLVGTELQKKLLDLGHEMTIFQRKQKTPSENPRVKFVFAPLTKEMLASHDFIINLAGEGIFNKRWTSKRKNEIYSSRVEFTNNLVSFLNGLPLSSRPKLLISCSAIGYYGTAWTKAFTEESQTGDDFLADLCLKWEASAKNFKGNVTIARLGIVLSKKGGMLKQLNPLYKLGLGGTIHSGKQWISWIHIDDCVEALIKMLDSPPNIYNVVSPHCVRQEFFAKELANSLNRPCFFGVSDIVLRMVLGERARYLITGQKVIPQSLINISFHFKFAKLADALRSS